MISRDFSGSPVIENPPCNAGDMGSIPGKGRSHMPIEQLSPRQPKIYIITHAYAHTHMHKTLKK